MNVKNAELAIIGLTKIPEIRPGDHLSPIIVNAAGEQGVELRNKDVLVIAQKIVSKSEGRLLNLSDVHPSDFASNIAMRLEKDPRLVEVILKESKRIVKMDKGTLIVETKHGFVCANAGVDQSNIPGADAVSLLPEDPDASAESIREGIEKHFRVKVAVIVSDTFGRPWREGLLDVAIGLSGFNPLSDYRGQKDRYGHLLKSTVIAVADQLAAAAGLLMGKTKQVPVAIVRGYDYEETTGRSRDLIRDPQRDLFR